MPGNMTRGYDLVIEISLGRVADSLKALLDQETGSQIGDAINGALDWAIKDFNYVCAIDDISFRIPDSIAGQVEHHSLYNENVYLKLSFNENYSILQQAVPIKITLEMVIGVDIGACIPQVSALQFARLDLKNLFGYYRTSITLNDSSFAGTIRDILDILHISADELLQKIIDDMLGVAGTSHEELDGKFKTALQGKVPYIPIPIIPIYIPDSKSTDPLKLIDADCRALETADNEHVLTYLFTYGGGTPGDRWAFDNFAKSDILPGNDAAIIVSFQPYTCRMIKGAMLAALNLTGADASTFSQGFRNCKLWTPVVIDAEENVTLTNLSVQILPPGFTIPFLMTLEDGGIMATATITKSGTCYSASGSLTALILIHHDGNNNVIIDHPFVNIDVDAGVDIWCKVAAAAVGIFVLPDPAINAVVDAIIYEIMDSIVDTLSKNAIDGVTDALTAAMSTMSGTVPQIPGVETMLKMITVDDVTMGYTFNVVRKVKLSSVMPLSPAEGAHLSVPAGSKCTTVLKWAAVPGATGYLVEVLYGYSKPGEKLTWNNSYKGVVEGTQLTFDFAGANPGMWRVTALDKTGKYWQSEPGRWRTFSWTPVLLSPALISPAEGQHLSAPAGSKCTMTLQWQAVSGATGYLVEVQYGNLGPDGSMIWSGAYNNTVTGTQLTFDFAGANPGRWRVTALDKTGWYGQSAPGQWRTFSWTLPLRPPTLVSPAEGEHLTAPAGGKCTMTLLWQAVSGATGYLVEVQYGNPGPDGVMIWGNAYLGEVAGTQLTFDFAGANPGRWRITALDKTGWYGQSDPAQWRSFSWAPELPAPVLLSPAKGEHLEPHGGKRTTLLQWQAVPGATGYLVEVQYGNPGRNRRMIWSSAYSGEVAGTQVTFEFVGANPGRWRVTALDKTGRYWRSDPAQWRTFKYTV